MLVAELAPVVATVSSPSSWFRSNAVSTDIVLAVDRDHAGAELERRSGTRSRGSATNVDAELNDDDAELNGNDAELSDNDRNRSSTTRCRPWLVFSREGLRCRPPELKRPLGKKTMSTHGARDVHAQSRAH